MFLRSDFYELGSTRDFLIKILIDYSAVQQDNVYKPSNYTYYDKNESRL